MQFFARIFLLLFFISPAFAADIPYCKDTHVTPLENAVIQNLVSEFSQKMNCSVGKNCLLKWAETADTEKFSIAWEKQCGPNINGQYQLGDQGHGSTFTCHFPDKNTFCCAPLGFSGYDVCGKKNK